MYFKDNPPMMMMMMIVQLGSRRDNYSSGLRPQVLLRNCPRSRIHLLLTVDKNKITCILREGKWMCGEDGY